MNWGVPDWRDAGAYPRHDALTDGEWRWQFTRRRPDYRELWQLWEPINRARIMADEAGHRELPATQGDTIEIFFNYAPTDDPDTLRLKYRMSVVLDPTKDFDVSTLAGAHYPVDGATLEPPQPNPDILPEQWRDRMVAVDRASRQHIARLRQEHGVVTYLFDLGRPLGPQLTQARRALEESQKLRSGGKMNTRKPRRSNWPLFLRALDAKDAKATYGEMRAAFWPRLDDKDESSARDVYFAAVQVRDNFPV